MILFSGVYKWTVLCVVEIKGCTLLNCTFTINQLISYSCSVFNLCVLFKFIIIFDFMRISYLVIIDRSFNMNRKIKRLWKLKVWS